MVSTIILVLLAALCLLAAVAFINGEILKLQRLARNQASSAWDVDLMVPNSRILQRLSLKKWFVVVALATSPLLSVLYILSMMFVILFILFPQLVWEGLGELKWSLRSSK